MSRIKYLSLYIIAFSTVLLTQALGQVGAGGKIRTTAFVNVNVVPMDTERILTAQTVIVRDGRIAQIGPVATTKVPKGALRIEGQGRYLMPGLTDMHMHIIERELLKLYLANGVTTVRNMAGEPFHLYWRQQIAAGRLLGPTIYTAGPLMESRETSGSNQVTVKTRAEAEASVAEQKAAGYDFIKVYNSLSVEAYDGIIAAARRLDMPVTGHVSRATGLISSMKAGQTSIDHMEEFLYTYDFQTDDDIKSVVAVAKETGVAVTPTLVTYDYIGRQVGNIQELLERPELKYMEPSVLRSWGPENNSYRKRIKAEQAPRMQQLLAFQKKLVKQMHDAGVPILVGTDAGGYGGSVPYVLPGFSMREELLALVDAGLTPYEALRGATSDAAKVLRGEKEFGTVTTGKRADLILLTENPLKNVAQLDKQLGVMVRGRWLPARELQDMLDELPRLYATEANFIQQVRQVGAAQALAQYRTAQRAAPRTRFFREGALNSLGYDLLNEKKIKDALEIFKLNVALYPDSADVYDSLAEAYMLDGQRELAIKSYRRSLALNPQNSNAVKMLRQLQRQ